MLTLVIAVVNIEKQIDSGNALQITWCLL